MSSGPVERTPVGQPAGDGPDRADGDRADGDRSRGEPSSQVRRPGIRLARVMGVPVYLAPSWFLFAGFVVYSFGGRYASVDGAAAGYLAAASYAVLLLVSVLLHELGHTAVARMFGLPVRSITVSLLAGMTDIAEPPQTPAREYAVAVAGPLVSLLLAGIGFASLGFVPDDTLLREIAQGLTVINVLVGVFNLLPGLPLDGGRVLRALLWQITRDEHGSTRAAAWAGRGVAVLVPLLLLGALPSITGQPPDVVTAVLAALVSSFIFLGASASLRQAEVARRLPGISVAALARPALGVPADLPLSEALRRAREAGAGGLVVIDSAGAVDAVVSEAAVLATPEVRRPWVTVGTLARRVEPAARLDPALSGEPLLAAMRRTPATEYVIADPVTDPAADPVADPVAGPADRLRVLVASDVTAAVTGTRAAPPRPAVRA